jgi:hypothetical protein
VRSDRKRVKRLAGQMAEVAREIRENLLPVWGQETADGMAQTMCYELFAARVNGRVHRGTLVGGVDFFSERTAACAQKLQNFLNEFLGRPRGDVTEQLLRPNLALASLRQIRRCA